MRGNKRTDGDGDGQRARERDSRCLPSVEMAKETLLLKRRVLLRARPLCLCVAALCLLLTLVFASEESAAKAPKVPSKETPKSPSGSPPSVAGSASSPAALNASQNKEAPRKQTQSVYGEVVTRGRALQIVSPNEHHTGFVINEEALAELEKIPGPVSVVAVMGPIHSGKSFFLNSVLRAAEGDSSSGKSFAAAPTKAFPVGYTVAPGSLGLSFWSEPILVEKTSGKVISDQRRSRDSDVVKVLVLDSEGFGGPNVTRSYDQLLYAVGSLLSSQVIFTSMKMIDAQALQLLEDLTRDANLFSLRAYARALREKPGDHPASPLLKDSNSPSREEYSFSSATEAGARRGAAASTEEAKLRRQAASLAATQSSSALLSLLSPCCLWWVVQDFVQDLGKHSAQEWFERLLKTTRWLTPISALSSDSSDATQHSLHSLYSSVKCVALGAPTKDTSLLQRLDKLRESQVDPLYAAAFAAVRRDLLRSAAEKPKMKLSSQPDSASACQGGRSDGKQTQCSDASASFQSMLKEVPMTGRDVAELVRFLVAAANANMFDDVQIFINHFSAVRSAMAKNDLLLLYERDLQQQQRAQTAPLLPSEVTAAAAAMKEKTLSLWRQQIGGEVYVERSQVQQQEAQLEEKIEQITAKAVANASRLVGSYCEAAAAVQLSVQREAIQRKAKKLPVAPSELAAFSSNLQQRDRAQLIRRLQTSERNYTETEACGKALDSHFEAVQTLHLELITQNLEKITERIQKAADGALLLLQRQVQQQQVDLLRPLSEYKGLLLDWQQAAWTAFEAEVASVREVGDFYDEAATALSERLRKYAEGAVAVWESKCRDSANEVVSRWKGLFRPQVVGALETPLPVEEAVLAQALKESKAAAFRELERLYCNEEQPWREVRRSEDALLAMIFNAAQKCHPASSLLNRTCVQVSQQFQKDLEEMAAALETENLEAIRVVCKQPLDNLREELKATAETYYFWASFSNRARQLGEEVILASSEAVVSKSLARKAAAHWAEGELSSVYRPLIVARLWGLVWLAGGLLLSVVGVILSFKISANFIWLAAFGAVAAFGVQAVIAALRTAFEEVVFGLLQYMYYRLGLEMSVVVVFLGISIFSVYLYSRLFAEAEKRAAVAQNSVGGDPSLGLGRCSTTSAVPSTNRFSQPSCYTTPYAAARPTAATTGMGFGRNVSDFQSTLNPRASTAAWQD